MPFQKTRTRVCNKCGKEFFLSVKIEGKYRYLAHRQFCLDCSNFRGTTVKSLVCVRCGKEFKGKQNIDGVRKGFYNRKYCLECIPFGTKIHNPNRHVIQTRKCCLCQKEYQYQRRKGHKAHRCNSCVTVARQIGRKKKSIEYKGGECVCCGYQKYYGALQFHHLDPTVKEYQIGGNCTVAWEKLKKELDKCILVCSICHAEIHAGVRTYNGCQNQSGTTILTYEI